MSPEAEHTDVDAYALGLLDGDDRRAFEAHLPHCESCAAELREMAGAARALSELRDVPAVRPGPPPGPSPHPR
ncbi:zf-HC2 domain-containing protein [Actinomadura viridis]|uniref:zf-HC2 domain-containing protein n=1 Tax=Actinomadura viridis TaxID=58110 RepID=UPI0036907EC5